MFAIFSRLLLFPPKGQRPVVDARMTWSVIDVVQSQSDPETNNRWSVALSNWPTAGFELVHPTDRGEHVLAHTAIFRADIGGMQIAAGPSMSDTTIV